MCRHPQETNYAHCHLVPLLSFLFPHSNTPPAAALFVGSRRFPVDEIYSNDLANGALSLPPKMAQAAAAITKQTADGRPRSSTAAKLQLELVVAITRHIGRPGSAVLVFGG